MKALKTLLILTTLFLLSCASEEKIDTTPIIQRVTATLDLADLNNLTGTDATSLISFNGVPAANYTTEAIIGDEIRYEITTSSSDTVLRFVEFNFSSGSENLWNEGLTTIEDNSGWLLGFEVLERASNEDELKFDMYFQLEVNSILQSEIYSIDPKIKIRARR